VKGYRKFVPVPFYRVHRTPHATFSNTLLAPTGRRITAYGRANRPNGRERRHKEYVVPHGQALKERRKHLWHKL